MIIMPPVTLMIWKYSPVQCVKKNAGLVPLGRPQLNQFELDFKEGATNTTFHLETYVTDCQKHPIILAYPHPLHDGRNL